MRITLCSCLIWIFTFVGHTSAQGVDNATQSAALLKYLIAGWKAEREKLVQGKVQWKGFEESADGKKPFTLTLTFDRQKGIKRYYIDWKGWIKGWWQTTPEWTASCPNDSSPLLELHKYTDEPHSFQVELDPRCLGAELHGDLDEGLWFDKLAREWENPKYHSFLRLRQRAHGVYHFGGEKHTEGGLWQRWELAINEEKGFSFEELEVSTKRSQTQEWVLASRTECQWKEINKIWVPVHEVSYGVDRESKTEIDLTWENVGMPFGDNEFALDSLGPPNGTTIVDLRLSREDPVMIGKIGEDYKTPPAFRSNAGQLRPRSIALIALSIAAFAIIVLVYYLRKRKSKSKT